MLQRVFVGVSAWNLGSTVQQVLAVARGSVLVARSISPAPSALCLKRILVPATPSETAETTGLPRIANVHGAELVLVHVVEEPQPTERAARAIRVEWRAPGRAPSPPLRIAVRVLANERDVLAQLVTNAEKAVLIAEGERGCRRGIAATARTLEHALVGIGCHSGEVKENIVPHRAAKPC